MGCGSTNSSDKGDKKDSKQSKPPNPLSKSPPSKREAQATKTPLKEAAGAPRGVNPLPKPKEGAKRISFYSYLR